MSNADVVTNTSTGLMAIQDLAKYYNVLIDIHFSDNKISITIRSKDGPLRLCGSFYCQDAYKGFETSDDIYHWIVDAVERVKGEK
jgi:hypothetical protein|nr:MAG TPA: hypothetical protein [Caudoviricetes sp.]